jgi:hypothetical protein
MACGCVFGAATNREAVVVEPGILAGASDFDGSRYALSASTATVSTVPTAAKYFKISMGRPSLSPPIPQCSNVTPNSNNEQGAIERNSGLAPACQETRHDERTGHDAPRRGIRLG